MVDIKLSGRHVTVTDALREHVEEKIGAALKVFDIKPMTCDVVLRVDSNKSNPDNQTCEVTVHARGYVVRVVASLNDMYAAIDEAASKVARQLRKYKTKVVDKKLVPTSKTEKVKELTLEQMDALLEPVDEKDADDDDLLVRVKHIDLIPMSEEQALVQTDLLGHDFFVYIDELTGLTNVVYHRKNGGYGILKPNIEENEE